METIWATMKMKKKRKKKSNSSSLFFRRPAASSGHFHFARLTIVLAGLAWLAGAALIAEPTGGAQSSSSSHAHDFLIFTTVFTDQGFALSGARVRVRRLDEKKFRWEGVSDRRGELAFRVPQNMEYEMTIEARGFKPETRKIDTRDDNRTDLTIRMELPSQSHSDQGPGGKQ
jgi:hypothetical protein